MSDLFLSSFTSDTILNFITDVTICGRDDFIQIAGHRKNKKFINRLTFLTFKTCKHGWRR